MNATQRIRREAMTLAITTASLISFVLCSASASADSVQPQPEATPAYMFLDLPAEGVRAATEFGVLSFSYDAEAGVPLHRHDSAMGDDANIRVTLVLAKSDAAIPIAAKTTYASMQIVETDSAKTPVKRLTFHTVKIVTVGPDGDEPTVRVVFTAASVSNH